LLASSLCSRVFQHVVLMPLDVRYTHPMPAPDQKPSPPGETWPPSPTADIPAALAERRADWFRPALWLGLGFNILACWPTLELLRRPAGDEIGTDGPMQMIFVTAVSALAVGIPITIWQMLVRQKREQSAVWEWVSLASCLMPFPLGAETLSLVIKAKAFIVVG